MRVLSMVVALTAFAAVQARAQDPTVVDSTHYKLVFENDEVRVLRITYGPREKSVMHEHPAAVAVFLTNSTARFTLPDGQMVDAAYGAGDAIWTEAGPHLPQNLGDQPFEVILVEIKAPGPRSR